MKLQTHASQGNLAACSSRAPGWQCCARAVFALVLLALPPQALHADGLRILEDDRAALQARIDVVARAQTRIDLAYFCIGDDDLAVGLLALLRDAAQRGVRVRVLVDAMHNEIPAGVQAELVRSGVEVRNYHPARLDRPDWITTRLHDKVWLIDARELITGGRNLEARYFGYEEFNFRDRDVYVTGRGAAAAGEYFDAIWRHDAVVPFTPPQPSRSDPNERVYGGVRNNHTATKQRAAAERQLADAKAALVTRYGLQVPVGPDWSREVLPVTAIRFLYDPPGEKANGAGITHDLEALIRNAAQSIEIETPYLVLSERFSAALAAARTRGVQVRIATNSLGSTNSVIAQAAYTSQREAMLGLGIELWEYHGPRCLHSKSFVIDSRQAVIGSFNLDPRSELRDTQVAVLIDDPRVALQLAALHAGNRQSAARYAPGSTQQPASAAKASLQRKAFFGVSRLLWPLVKDEL
ncbi:MAG: phosphatidylserine/phosphatidylglycerophosphate/cardiolipin synthase family protein [Pirellulales bacterium]|nr:phosphatidylserine/phosphatidylglycerophosphate/cardiolipin synthase family protein [Pirellulales bacterium]